MELVLEVLDLITNLRYHSALTKISDLFANADLTEETRAKLYFYRAICYSESEDFESALKDLDICEPTFGKSSNWHFRVAVAQFMTEDFSNALISFKKAEEADDLVDTGLKSRVKAWINKSTIELGNENAGNINDSIYMKTSNLTQPSTPVEVPVEAPVVAQSETQSTTTDELTSEDAMNIKELSHDWYQNTEYVFLSILKKKFKGEVSVSISPDSILIRFVTGEKFIGHLAHSINAGDSSYSQTDKKVELKLKKQESGIVWDVLSREQATEKHQKDSRPSYPSSNPNKRNWEEVDKDCKKDLAAEKEEDNDAMNALLKKIYAGADEETRRAMIKSYQTSNGTVLSTSWGDVKNKDYEGKDYVSPPDHFEAKKPEF